MTDEVLITFITECERIVDGRSLAPVISPSSDLPLLAPKDSLIMGGDFHELLATTLRERLVHQREKLTIY